MPLEPQKEFRAAFELDRAKRIDGRIPEEGTGGPGDSWTTRANRAAFLVLERERRVLAARLHRAHRHRSDRYRDLILITKLIRLEHEHLIGQVGPSATSLPEALPAFGRERLEDWAQPWGVGPMFELRTEFIDYRHQCHRLAKWRSAASRARAAAEAERRLDGILRGRDTRHLPPARHR
ncbi:MAG: hypothetical protein AABM43_12490 [Actinomycetota bacterium]